MTALIGIRIMDSQELKSVIYRLGETKSVLTETELLSAGASMAQIEELVTSSVLYPSAQGIYMPENADFGEQHTRVEVAVKFPDTVLCLATALNFHRLTTQMPHKVWIAYEASSLKPVEPRLPIEAIPMSEPGFSQGIEIHCLEGNAVKIYSVAKTVADCFVYEDEVGTDVAIEAFDQAIQESRCTVTEIVRYTRERDINSYAQQDLIECIERAMETSV